MFGRATIRLGIGPHSSCIINAADLVGYFTDALCTIVNSTIPKSKSKPVKLNIIIIIIIIITEIFRVA